MHTVLYIWKFFKMTYKKQSTLTIKMTHDLDIPNKMKYIIQSRKKHGVIRNVGYYLLMLDTMILMLEDWF